MAVSNDLALLLASLEARYREAEATMAALFDLKDCDAAPSSSRVAERDVLVRSCAQHCECGRLLTTDLTTDVVAHTNALLLCASSRSRSCRLDGWHSFLGASPARTGFLLAWVTTD